MKSKLIILICVTIFIDIVIGISLFKSRSFPRLAMWNIIESEKQADFYWPPNKAPGYFYFEPDDPGLGNFNTQISNLINSEDNKLKKVLTTAEYVMNLGKDMPPPRKRVRWDSPSNMLKQLNQGRIGNCFHHSIVFSTFLASIGIKSRLWALEGDDGLGRFGHTVAEVYFKDLNKWVMIDVTKELYFTENNTPLSVLELRESLLNRNTRGIAIKGNPNRGLNQRFSFQHYTRLLRMVFLRSANDFVNKFNAKIRYGRVSKLENLFDKFPSETRRGLSYLIGRRDYLMHYIDGFDKSLKPKIILARIFFYFFAISLISIVFLSLFFVVKILMNQYTHRHVL